MAGTQTDVTTSFTVNGINARDWGVELIGIEGRGLPIGIRAREFRFPDEGGAPRQYGDLPEPPVHRLMGYVVGDNASDCRGKYSDFLLNVGLPIDIEQQLIIRSVEGQKHILVYHDEPHKRWKALYFGGHMRRELKREQWKLGRYIYFFLEFKIPDVYAYGDDVLRELSLSATSHFINVPTGTAPSRPRIFFKNDTDSDITTLDVVGGRFAINSNMDTMDSNGYPKARNFKNDQWVAGDHFFQSGINQASISGTGSPNYLDSARNVDISGNYAYVASSADDALTVFDISDIANGNITHKASITGAGSPNYLDGAFNVAISGNYAYVVSLGDDALTVFDISDIANGNITHKASMTGAGSPNYLDGAYSVDISGNYAYVASAADDALTVFDISDIANGNITHKASITGAGSPNYLDGAIDVVVSGNYAYVASNLDDALTVFDISDIANGNITHKASITGAGSPNYLDAAYSVDISGNYAYVASDVDDALTVFDISDIANGNITHKASITGMGSPNYLDGAYSVDISGNYAYVASVNDDALTVFDISDIGNGNITHQAAVVGGGSPNYLNGAHGVIVSGNYVYVASYIDDALTVFNESTFHSLEFVPSRRGKGLQTTADLVVWGAPGNTDQWGCVWRGRPQFAYDDTKEVTLLEHYFDADNYFRLYYDTSNDKFVFRKYAYDVYEATTKAMTFSSDQEISLICSFDTKDGSQIYFNGSDDGSTPNSDTTALLTGTTTERGTAQAGASTSITLASTASASDDNYNDWVVEITGGTGAGQCRKITDYNGTTKVATITTAWTTNPDATSTYILYSSTVTLGGTTGGIQLANIITDEFAIFTHKITAHEAAAIHERNEPLFNHNGTIKLSATISSDDFVEIDCDDLDIQQYDTSENEDVSLLANGITTNNSRFFQLHPGEELEDGDIIWCENDNGTLEIRYALRYV